MLVFSMSFVVLVFKFPIAIIRRNAYNSISLCAFVWLQLGCFILEGLLVRKTVEESVSTTAHDDLLQISLLCLLHLLVLVVTVSPDAEILRVVLLLTSNNVSVFILKGIVVLIETFDKSVIVFLFLFITPNAFHDVIKNEQGETNKWS